MRTERGPQSSGKNFRGQNDVGGVGNRTGNNQGKSALFLLASPSHNPILSSTWCNQRDSKITQIPAENDYETNAGLLVPIVPEVLNLNP